MQKTLTKIDLIEAVYKKIGLPRKVIGDVVSDLLEQICVSLENGNGVKLSSFGTFHCLSKRKRIGRNPKTGEEVVISPRRVVSFKASNSLKVYSKQ